MFIVIAVALALVYAGLRPLAAGLLETSMWVAKILAPSDFEENVTTKLFLKTTQAALMEGWLSNVPFINTILVFSSIIAGSIYRWWGGVLIYCLAAILGGIAKVFLVRPVSYYLALLYHKMVNRAADYKLKNDVERFEASRSFCEDLGQVMVLYQKSQLKPPTRKQLKSIPYGDWTYWLERGADRT